MILFFCLAFFYGCADAKPLLLPHDNYRIGYHTQYDTKEQNIRLIKTYDEYVEYLNEPEIIELFSRNKLQNNCKKYNYSFFEENDLIIILLSAGSGSLRFEVREVNITDSELEVRIKHNNPQLGTCDMASWLMFVEVDNVSENVTKLSYSIYS